MCCVGGGSESERRVHERNAKGVRREHRGHAVVGVSVKEKTISRLTKKTPTRSPHLLRKTHSLSLLRLLLLRVTAAAKQPSKLI